MEPKKFLNILGEFLVVRAKDSACGFPSSQRDG